LKEFKTGEQVRGAVRELTELRQVGVADWVFCCPSEVWKVANRALPGYSLGLNL